MASALTSTGPTAGTAHAGHRPCRRLRVHGRDLTGVDRSPPLAGGRPTARRAHRRFGRPADRPSGAPGARRPARWPRRRRRPRQDPVDLGQRRRVPVAGAGPSPPSTAARSRCRAASAGRPAGPGAPARRPAPGHRSGRAPPRRPGRRGARPRSRPARPAGPAAAPGRAAARSAQRGSSSWRTRLRRWRGSSLEGSSHPGRARPPRTPPGSRPGAAPSSGWHGPGRMAASPSGPAPRSRLSQHRLGLVVHGVAGGHVGGQHREPGGPGPGLQVGTVGDVDPHRPEAGAEAPGGVGHHRRPRPPSRGAGRGRRARR